MSVHLQFDHCKQNWVNPPIRGTRSSENRNMATSMSREARAGCFAVVVVYFIFILQYFTVMLYNAI